MKRASSERYLNVCIQRFWFRPTANVVVSLLNACIRTFNWSERCLKISMHYRLCHEIWMADICMLGPGVISWTCLRLLDVLSSNNGNIVTAFISPTHTYIVSKVVDKRSGTDYFRSNTDIQTTFASDLTLNMCTQTFRQRLLQIEISQLSPWHKIVTLSQFIRKYHIFIFLDETFRERSLKIECYYGITSPI